jgi:hypothetical protein
MAWNYGEDSTRLRVVSMTWSGDMRQGRNGKAFSVGRLEEEV